MSIQFKVEGNVTTTLNNLKTAMVQLQQLPQDAFRYFVAKTPIDTGNARRSTSLNNKTISAQYPYAQRLDKGWSKQAPDGMIKPTEQFVKQRVRQITGK